MIGQYSKVANSGRVSAPAPAPTRRYAPSSVRHVLFHGIEPRRERTRRRRCTPRKDRVGDPPRVRGGRFFQRHKFRISASALIATNTSRGRHFFLPLHFVPRRARAGL
ncbi:hypothetical protein EVAR_36938_1 [Eumeta japonica]|uniref:Uncharacterized protein n=1 Tax=Eumeta variegata TaxID=151549 RepID=A0A4C1X406_EUMVA|nr:hypothetical protein EVAR_36938_1 [Eumeta japonica]